MISAPSALSAFSVQFAPWDAFCMTTGGVHDNGISLRFGANGCTVTQTMWAMPKWPEQAIRA